MQTLQDKLRAACGSIERLKSMAIRAKTLDNELSVQTQRNGALEDQHHRLKESLELTMVTAPPPPPPPPLTHIHKSTLLL